MTAVLIALIVSNAITAGLLGVLLDQYRHAYQRGSDAGFRDAQIESRWHKRNHRTP